jgi:hypothetical protein
MPEENRAEIDRVLLKRHRPEIIRFPYIAGITISAKI